MQLIRYFAVAILVAVVAASGAVLGFGLGRAAPIEFDWASYSLPEMLEICGKENPEVPVRARDEIDVWGGAWGGDAWLAANGVRGSASLLVVRAGLMERREPCRLLRRYRVYDDLSVTLTRGDESAGWSSNCWEDPATFETRCGGFGPPSSEGEKAIRHPIDLTNPATRHFYGESPSHPVRTIDEALPREECTLEGALSHLTTSVDDIKLVDCGTMLRRATPSEARAAADCAVASPMFRVIWEIPREYELMRRSLIAPGDGRMLWLQWTGPKGDEEGDLSMWLSECAKVNVLEKCSSGRLCFQCIPKAKRTRICE